ncbi:MAG: ADP-ribosylglycohydrolase family protein [Myxococcota bacterium]
MKLANVSHAHSILANSAPLPAEIGTGIRALDLSAIDFSQALKSIGLGGAAQSSPTVAANNKKALPEVGLAFAAPDVEAKAFAKYAIDSMLAGLEAADGRRAKADKRPPQSKEQILLKFTDNFAVAQIRIAFGVDENLKTKSKPEVEYRQRLSRAILADLSQRLWDNVSVDRLFRDFPRVAQALLEPKSDAAAAEIEGRTERAVMAQKARSFFRAVREAKEQGLDVSMAEMKQLTKADEMADANPKGAFASVQDLIQRAQVFLENPPAPHLSKEQLQKLKDKKSPAELLHTAHQRIAVLRAEVKDAPTPTELERFKGAMIGLAIGDALGGPTEFMDKEEIRERYGMVTDFVGGGWLKLKPGEYTDDTQMAELMAKSIVEKGGFNLEDIGERFVGWLKTDPKDVGGLTRQALELKALGVPAEQAGLIPWVLSGFENAGNGSVMRAAPIGLLTAFQSVETIDEVARASSAVTHADPRATYGTAAINLATSMLIKGEDDVTDKVAAWLKDKNPVLAKALLDTKTMDLEDLRTSGYSVHTVQAAFWALNHAKDYVDGVLKVSNQGEDTDTAGATAGILLGAKFGLKGIPDSWREKLQNHAGLEHLAAQIHTLAKGGEG